VTANCFHPGLVATGFNRNNGACSTTRSKSTPCTASAKSR
jgi:hypothetical protein